MAATSPLSDSAWVRLVTADPPLDGPGWSRLDHALHLLFSQFQREGRLSAWGADCIAGGAAVLLAWEGAETLSGCSQDTLGRLLRQMAGDGRRILDAPPLLVEIDGRPVCLDRAGVRLGVREGRITGESVWYDLRVESLGAWRQHGRTTLQATDLGRSLAAAGTPACNESKRLPL